MSSSNTDNAPSESWRGVYRKRGILDPMLSAGVTNLTWASKNGHWTPGIAYPLVDADGEPYQLPDGRPAQRWKNLNSKAKFKYAWGYPDSQEGQHKPADCDIYFLPQAPIRDTIAAANGAVHLVCGEPDAWTMIAVGISNVISFFGESNVPADLVLRLRSMNVETVHYYPDRDEGGEKGAAKLVEALDGSGIELCLYELPAEVNGRLIKDINDLYCAVGHDTEVFHQYLAAMPVQHLENPVRESEVDALNAIFRPTHTIQDDRTYTDLPAAFYEAIERKLGVESYKSNGFSNEVCCPFHEDRHPSAGWHGENHFLKCFVCGTFNAKEVGEKLGLDSRDFTDRSTPARSRRRASRGSSDGAGHDPDPEPASADKPKSATDDEIGDSLIAQWDGNVAFFHDKWHAYANGLWQPIQKVHAAIWDALINHKHRRVNPCKSRVKSVEDYLRARLFVPGDQIDHADDCINLRNGLFNLQTNQLEPYRRDLYLTAQLDFDYDPTAKCPIWDRFVASTLVTPGGQPDAQLIALLHEAIGYSLTARTYLETAFWLYGEAGSGKSTILKVLQGLLGSAYTTIDMNMLDKNSYQLADLPGKRVAACTEVKAGTRLADHIIKPLISGEDIAARQIYGQPFRFKSTAKVWWAMNELPTNADRSNAIYRRLKIIAFNHPIPRDQQDRHLIDKLLQELPGIFNRALEGLQRLNAQGDFTTVEQVEHAVDDYRGVNDTEAVFIHDPEWCSVDESLLTQASDLYIAYKAWCDRFGHPFKSSTAVARDWQRLGFEKIKNGLIRYRGIGLTGMAQKMVERVKNEKPAGRR